MTLSDILTPLQDATAGMGWLEWAQLAGTGIISWLGVHTITHGELR